ncbi:MAG: UDP-2,3-diacylglucosamine diphosphatase [Woeseiaceae bacterium]|nr:UDP-2,3-diacylglucosamine diphosphatase [Woeseiaceae bacterium]
MTTLFISDLHLEAERPEIGAQFIEFMNSEATSAEALYILGDLFESWVGDDDPNSHYADMKRAIRGLSDSGVPVYFMHGNRDFMIGQKFAEDTGVTLLDDPCPVELYGQSVLLAHGDAYCTDDVEYQQTRAVIRNPEWQQMMLKKPLEERLAIARAVRAESQARNAQLAEAIMDVNPAAIIDAIRTAGVDILLHGHTHRPAVHDVDLGDRGAKRIVLGDWYEQGSVVRWDENGFELCEIPRDGG